MRAMGLSLEQQRDRLCKEARTSLKTQEEQFAYITGVLDMYNVKRKLSIGEELDIPHPDE